MAAEAALPLPPVRLSRTQMRSSLPDTTRIVLLEGDADVAEISHESLAGQIDRRFDVLDMKQDRNFALLIGGMVTFAISSVLLAINLVTGTVH